ncbi:homogentisate 1,2-dioxygenase [Sporothrix schenckii ATCC 58251]|uniref:homogentisate 1,2-dioxygenase n=1 Tax=Sporothrix schenckii (strain ATCC 58251 / de Perez 2211183) TaxID=1391915 RepID=U7PKG5_SPOS1|nr:homogentisate 1,2-dioxygenase [Sporothrix schenckii ATCC 58251]
MASAMARGGYVTTPSDADPYIYQTGFGNRFASEAVPGALPLGQNTPQKCAFDLYSEQLNGSSFVVLPRSGIQHVWMYRVRPSVAHGPLQAADQLNPALQASFLATNPAVAVVPDQLAWDPFALPAENESKDFVEGIRTVGGQGDPSLRQGLAVHMYTANRSMGRRAFCNNDGDLLIMPQQGRLQIQTELGWLMVRPGEIVVVQAGLRFRVQLPDVDAGKDKAARGYIQEVYAAHFDLPELGPMGSNGMALPNDFESPVAAFDIDEQSWEVVYKLLGKLFVSQLDHSPFDVVAWRGNLVPFKYATEKFINVANVERDQADPTVYSVLTVRSTVPGVPLTDLLVFTPKWIPTSNTFRPPYYHRNMSSEVMGLLYGTYGGSAHSLEAGGLSYEASYMPHGETYETWVSATTQDLVPIRICEDTVAFMFHITVPLLLAKDAVVDAHPAPESQRAAYKPHFLERLSDVNAALSKAGAPSIDL